MKQLTFLLFAIIVLGCNTNREKNDLIIGTWDFVSVYDFESKEESLSPNGEKLIAEFKSDSLYLRSNIDNNTDLEIYAWQIKGDSIIIDEEYTGYIKKLTTKSLIIEIDVFGRTRYSLIKIN